ncbi:hypothetical protein GN956_G25528 [Arapaima gigas]
MPRDPTSPHLCAQNFSGTQLWMPCMTPPTQILLVKPSTVKACRILPGFVPGHEIKFSFMLLVIKFCRLR